MTMPDEDLSVAVRNLITMAAPERRCDIADLWSEYSPSFDVARDTGSFRMEAGIFGLVVCTPRSLAICWMLSHEAWASLDCYSTMLAQLDLCSQAVRGSFGRCLREPLDQEDVEGRLDDIAQKIDELSSGVNLPDFEWPSTIPIPSTDRPKEIRTAAQHEIACLVLAAMFLHEVCHVIKQDHEGLTPIELEHCCDAFAQNFLTERMSTYAKCEDYPIDSVAAKRAIALGIWCYAIHRIVGEHESDSHPSPSARLRRMLSALELPANNTFWIVMASMLINQLRTANHLPINVNSTSLSDLV